MPTRLGCTTIIGTAILFYSMVGVILYAVGVWR